MIVNDRADIALLAGADGVHVGQDDLPAEDVAAIVGPGPIVGLSTHNEAQMDEAAGGAGRLHRGRPDLRHGTKDTGYTRARARPGAAGARAAGKPVVAIGGITLERAPEVLAAGALAVAVISDLLERAERGASLLRVRDPLPARQALRPPPILYRARRPMIRRFILPRAVGP